MTGRGQEEACRQPSGLPWTTLRATKFCDLVLTVARQTAGLAPDMAGPRVYPMAELLRGYLQAAGKRRPLVPVRLPGQAARAVRAGANLAPERAVGRRTWEEFLAERASRLVPRTVKPEDEPLVAGPEGATEL